MTEYDEVKPKEEEEHKSPLKTEAWFGFKSTKDLKERWDWYKLEKKVVINPNEQFFDDRVV